MGLVLLRKGSQCLQILAFPDLNNYCNNICSCLSTELYVATALETQEQANKLLKTTVHKKFYPCWPVWLSSFITC